MEEHNYVMFVNGELFPFTEEQVNNSPFLRKTFASYPEVTLEIKEEYMPAFLYLYNYLRGRETEAPPTNMRQKVFSLAKELNVSDYFPYVLYVDKEAFPLSERQVSRSNYLKRLFHSSFGGKKELRVDPEDLPAFLWIYYYLADEVLPLPEQIVTSVLNLARFLDIEDLFDYMASLVKKEDIEVEVTEDFFQLPPQIRKAAFQQVLKENYDLTHLPQPFYQIFLSKEARQIPEKKKYLYLSLTPLKEKPEKTSVAQLEELNGNFSSLSCEHKPKIIKLQNVPYVLSKEGRVYDYRGSIVACPKKHPNLDEYNLCCVSAPTFPQAEEFSDILQGSKPMMSSHGLLVFVPKNYHRNYIFGTNYIVLGKLSALLFFS